MSTRPLIAAGFSLPLSDSLPALGQDIAGPEPPRVASGRVDEVTKKGQTVPRPNKHDLKEGNHIQRRTREQARDDAMTHGIRIGCLR